MDKKYLKAVAKAAISGTLIGIGSMTLFIIALVSIAHIIKMAI